MEKDLYRIMQGILKEKGTKSTKDIRYMGTITQIEKVGDVDTKTVKDIFMIIEELEDGTTIQKFYDENGNFVGGRNKEGKLLPAQNLIEKDVDYLDQIEDLEEKPGISLSEIEGKLEKIAKKLGIKKEDIIAMSEVSLEQKIDENKKEKEEDKKLTLEDDTEKKETEEKDEKEKTEQNKRILEKMNAKQEIDLDKKIDDRHTLGDVLGVRNGAKLIAVYSNAIENNSNTTRFSFVIQNADGSLENADMLNQVGGKDSDKNIYEVNRDGSQVTNKSVQTSYQIKSPIARNGVITARVGQMGYIEVGYGEIDPTSHRDALTQELETDHTYYTTYQVREEFSHKNGTNNIRDDIDEIKEHEEHGCENITLEEADGDKTTGHKHLDDEEYMASVIEQIKQYDENIEEIFTDAEIKEYLEKEKQNNPEISLDEVIQKSKHDLSEDASHMRTR